MAITQNYVDYGAGNDTTGDGSVGTPWKTLQKALDTLTRNTSDGNQVNLKAGTAHVNAAALDLATFIAGGALSGTGPLIIRGYTSSANDGGIGEIDCGGATMFAATSYDFVILRDLEIHNGGNNDLIDLDTYAQFINCEFHKGASSPSGKNLVDVNGDGVFLGCHFHDAGTSGLCLEVTAGVLVYGCHFDVGTANFGVQISGGNPARVCITRNVFRLGAAGATAVASSSSGNFWVFDNDIYNSAAGTAKGLNASGFRNMAVAFNNIFAGFSGAGGEGIDVAADSGFNIFGYNAFYNNTANYTLGDVVHTDLGNDDTLGGSAWVNAGTGDFDINGTVSGVTEDAYPAAFLGLASTSPKADKGAVQAGAGAGGEAHLDSEVLDTATTPGTYHAPDAAEVISTAVFGVNSGTSGTVVQASVGDVKDGVTYGPSSGLTGTYDPLAAAVFPAEANTLEAESAYGPTGAEYAGTYHAPDAAEVIDSAVFGPSSGTAGTYDTSGTPPTAAEIADAVWDEARAGHVAAGSFGAVSEWASTGGLDAAGVRTAVGLASANLDTQLGAIPTLAELQAEFAALADDTDIATAVRTELATELAEVSATNLTTDKLDTALELDGAVYRLTTNALEQAPGTDAASVAAAILETPANLLKTDASGRVEVSGTKNTLDALLTALQGAGWTDETLVELGALLDAIKAKTDGLPASPAAVGSAMTLTAAYDAAKTAAQAGDAMTLDAAALTAIGARIIEGTHTQDDVLRLVLALISKVSGAGTGTLTYRDASDTKDRIVQTVDGSGNRSAVTLDGTL